MQKDRFSLTTALSVVVANMIGTGVFTSLGFQLQDIRSTFALLMLWLVGGITALCGALSYAELGAALPRSGGEYTFLSRIYHPMAGFISGWVSASIGFAAPTALAAITFGAYLTKVFPGLSPSGLACGLVIILSIVHAGSHKKSGLFQRLFTSIKVGLILAFCAAAGIWITDGQPIRILPQARDTQDIFSSAFAVSLIYVSYAFTGWNAATYITSELAHPQRDLPKILGGGTLIVMVLYLALNYVFLYAAPMEEMVGQLEVGYIAAEHIFGSVGANIMGVTLAILLISTVSAMVLAGPRVLHVIGEDYPLFQFLGKKNVHGIPTAAIYFQGVLTLLFILSGSFESILVFAGFTLGLNTFLAVLGVFILRWKAPELPRPYRAWAYPITPFIYLALTGWTLVYLLIDRPVQAGLGLLVVALGAMLYGVSWWRDKDN